MIDNFEKVKKVLWSILVANITVAILKIVVGSFIKSNSMTADGFHSLTDGSSNIVGLIGIRFASKPVDEDHPYGHGKFEMLAGFFIAVMLLFIGGNVIINTVDRILNPVIPDISVKSLVILLITLLINIVVSRYEYVKGKECNSQILISDSTHTKSDIYVSIGVFVTLICIKFGLPAIIDSFASFGVAGFIFHAAYEIYRDNSGILVDKVAIDTKEIEDIVLCFGQIKDIHHIRSRGYGNDIYIDMHIMTEPEMSVEKSHELIHEIEEKIIREMGKNIELTVHLEPFDKSA